jgi:hypothetical protein
MPHIRPAHTSPTTMSNVNEHYTTPSHTDTLNHVFPKDTFKAQLCNSTYKLYNNSCNNTWLARTQDKETFPAHTLTHTRTLLPGAKISFSIINTCTHTRSHTHSHALTCAITSSHYIKAENQLPRVTRSHTHSHALTCAITSSHNIKAEKGNYHVLCTRQPTHKP